MKKQIDISLYWKCQLIGWSVAAMYWQVIGFTGTNFSATLALIHFAADLLIYIPLTHVFRNFSYQQGWHQMSTQKLIIRLIPAVLILGAAFMFLTISKNYLIRYFFQPEFTETYVQNIKSAWLVTYATGIRLMLIWLLAYYGYHFAQREINAVKESARLSIIAKDAKFDNLSAQLNPHFFFNSLNSIKALVIENPHAARRAIDLLSDLLRTSLYERDNNLISLESERQLISDYLELEKIRFEKKLTIDINVGAHLSQIQVLPLSVQLLVENAIKHGIAQSKGGGHVSVNIDKQNGFLRTIVYNTGRLRPDFNYGVGLSNLTERLKLQYTGNASFELKQANESTVSATLLTPLP